MVWIISLMKNEGKINHRKTMNFCVMNLTLRVRFEYANIDGEINQYEHDLSFTTV